MHIHMRTTLIVDDELFKKAKKRAAAEGSTLSEVVNNALRDSLNARPDEEALPPFKMITFGDPTRPVHREPAEFSEILEQDDLQTVHRKA